MLLCDFYKLAHRAMYPAGTEIVYSTWTPRATRIPWATEYVWFGLSPVIRRTIFERFNRTFFEAPRAEVVADYTRIVKACLGDQAPETAHIEALHEIGYLPLRIRALPEGTIVPLRTPVATFENTDKRFPWLTNYLETIISLELWKPSTSATIAREYRKLFERYAAETGADASFCQFQGHDFSMRGMDSLDGAIASGLGHLTSFVGTDTIPAIQGAEYYYGANVEKELVGCSVPASEHSVECAFGDDEAYIKHLITSVHPTGIVSCVSDGYDFFRVLTETLPKLKRTIMARDGKLVIRPDSGDPVKIVCGDPESSDEAVRKGAVQLLWETFGGTETIKGFRCLDSHIGLIYGDAITYERADEILKRLASKGFASSNIVFGIGSFTYAYNTRDTFGHALKSTLVVINGEEKQIFKAPKTDDGTKYSQRGRVAVRRGSDGALFWTDGHRLDEHVAGSLLEDVFRDGTVLRFEKWSDVKARVAL